MSSFYLMSAVVHQALLFLPMALGIFITYRVMRLTDLTVDGSFVLGAAVFAKCSSLGIAHPILYALGAGMLCGCLTSIVMEKVRPLLAGILVLFILQSFNLMIMGRPNISLLNTQTIPVHTAALICYTLAICSALGLTLRCKAGLLLRAYGDNPDLLQDQGYSSLVIRSAGLALSNALVVFSGVLTAQSSGFADTQMGQGMVLIGIGTVVLGQQLIKQMVNCVSFNPGIELLSCFCGVLLYFTTMHFLLSIGVPFLFLKMLIGVCLAIIMMYTGSSYAKFSR